MSLTAIRPDGSVIDISDNQMNQFYEILFRRDLENMEYRSSVNLEKELDETGSKTMLDVGSGLQYYDFQLAKKGKKITLLDNKTRNHENIKTILNLTSAMPENDNIITETLEALAARGITENDLEEIKHNFNFIQADITEKKLVKKVGQFDYVLASYIMQYLPTGQGFHVAMHNINDMSKNGYLIVRASENWNKKGKTHVLYLDEEDKLRWYVTEKELKKHFNENMKFYVTSGYKWNNINIKCVKNL